MKKTKVDIAKFSKAFEEAKQSGLWNPSKVGDAIGGKLIKIEKQKPSKKIKNPSRIITIQNEYTGKAVSFFEKTVIAERFKELNIKIGDVIGIQYDGAKMSANGKKVEYHKYIVVKI